MESHLLPIGTNKVMHPKVLKTLMRNFNPISPKIKAKDPVQPSHGSFNRLLPFVYTS